ncbi:MAG: biotin--protein ligase [Candidatus Bathyarchaeota archaeon]|nr:biotin--protein ligase [Candidatus Bathyarchaeota archaeon]MDH5792673.1 biotin--protein ligase [Candidatus Bathyarchaeota archaeon]
MEFKVPGGKLIAAEAEAEGGRIVRVKITGDFFMHPEEAIEELEVSLTGVPEDERSLEEAVNGFFGGRSIELIGVSPGDFVHVIRMSLGSP